MESAVAPDQVHHPEPKKQAQIDEIFSLLEYYAPKIKILSLDCFDTILWRKTATPEDVFFDLQEQPVFKSIGLSARLRAQAEESARHKMLVNYGITEVNLTDVYQAHSPSLTTEQINALAEEELAAEINACYMFPPMIELMRRAHQLGLKIIIVSDTYLNEKQLRRLLQACLPEDVMAMIMKIFCSSEHGQSKSMGLFNKVCKILSEPTRSFLHIGDNIAADFNAPQALGISAIHFVHHQKIIGELIRMQALAGGFIDPMIRHNRSLSNPYKGIFAASKHDITRPEAIIGYLSAGPIMYAFGRYICTEVDKLKAEGKKVKVLFLMRDAYLPSLACEAIEGREIGKRVRISRFAAFAASFISKKDVDKYLCDNVSSLRFYDMCKQLLLPEKMSLDLSKKAAKSSSPQLYFIELLRQPAILEKIFSASKAYRARLVKHLQNEVGIQAGDTLVFVDLGYTGTAQLKLEPVFRDELNIEIVGRYLISLRTNQWESSRSGLMDSSWCDDRTMQTLVAYIALLEQICTSNEKSVVDYDQHGNPIYSETSVSKAQHDKLEMIQTECLRFVQDANEFFKQANTHVSPQILRDAAMSELTRLLFLPTATELEYLKTFQFDLNLGTKDLINVFDHEKGLTGLRRRGLFFMEKNLKSMRTNYPAELRYAGLELGLTLMAQHRIGFDVRVNDLSLRRETLNVIVIHNGNSTQASISALPTYDGYFALIVPIGLGNFQVGIQFGLNYQWVQLESTEIITTSTLYSSRESEHTEDAAANMAIDQMEHKGDGLYECLSNTGLLVYMPNQKLENRKYALRVVFRPITYREKTESVTTNA